MPKLDIPRLRMHNQLLTRHPARSPAAVVAHFGAVQAQEYPACLWAVGVRLPGGATEASVERAVDQRKIVRTWPMRGTLHFVAAEDVRWMVRLLAPRVVRGAAGRYRQLELDAAVFRKAGRVIEHALADGPVQRRELLRLLREAGIVTHENRGGQIIGYHAMHGLICFGPRDGKQATMVLLDDWVTSGRDLEGDEALAELATRYFTSHGPAQVRDFCWWSGLTLREARRAIEAAELRSDVVDGVTYWRGTGRVMRAEGKTRAAWLLPPFDEYTVAYRDRSAVLDPAYAREVNAGGGIFAPIVVVDGEVVGRWAAKRSPDGLRFEMSAFGSWPIEESGAVREAARAYAAFPGEPLAAVT